MSLEKNIKVVNKKSNSLIKLDHFGMLLKIIKQNL